MLKAVVLATGGFAGDVEYMKLILIWQKIFLQQSPSGDGTGIKWLKNRS